MALSEKKETQIIFLLSFASLYLPIQMHRPTETDIQKTEITRLNFRSKKIFNNINSNGSTIPIVGNLYNIFSLVFGINLIVVGLVAFISGIVSLVQRAESVKKLTSIAYIIAGVAAVYFGVILSRSAYNM